MGSLFFGAAHTLTPIDGILIADLCLRRGLLTSFYFTGTYKVVIILSAVRSANHAQYGYDDSQHTV